MPLSHRVANLGLRAELRVIVRAMPNSESTRIRPREYGELSGLCKRHLLVFRLLACNDVGGVRFIRRQSIHGIRSKSPILFSQPTCGRFSRAWAVLADDYEQATSKKRFNVNDLDPSAISGKQVIQGRDAISRKITSRGVCTLLDLATNLKENFSPAKPT